MILAGIDIGTNTLRLLIAETGPDSFRELYSDRRITRLGQHLDRTGRLSPDAQERSIDVLADFSRTMERYEVRNVSAIGTSALRNAANSSEFIAGTKRRTGLEIRVISGEEEARLTLLGVSRALRGLAAAGRTERLDSALVIDIGGGSTEIITTRPGAGPTETSLPLGAVYLTERFIKHDPPIKEELDLLGRSIRKELDKYRIIAGSPAETVLAGTAGTITTLAAMDQKLAQYEPDRINGFILTRESVDRLVHAFITSTLKERRKMPGLEEGREDIILAGALVTREIMEKFGFRKMIVSDWGLREGIIFDLYDKLHVTKGR